jgi:hypothetical protein
MIPTITTQAQAQGDIVLLYAAKHNPFVYFRDVQEGTDPRNSLKNVVGFDGPGGLYPKCSTRASVTMWIRRLQPRRPRRNAGIDFIR